MMFICLLCVSETGRKTLKLGALATLNLPQKSVETRKFPERRQIIKTATESKNIHFRYKDFLDFPRQMFKMKFRKEWQMDISGENKVGFKYFSKPYLIPKFEIMIDERLEFTLATDR